MISLQVPIFLGIIGCIGYLNTYQCYVAWCKRGKTVKNEKGLYVYSVDVYSDNVPYYIKRMKGCISSYNLLCDYLSDKSIFWEEVEYADALFWHDQAYRCKYNDNDYVSISLYGAKNYMKNIYFSLIFISVPALLYAVMLRLN